MIFLKYYLLVLFSVSLSIIKSQNSLILDTTFGPSGNPININQLPGVSVNVLPTYSQIRELKIQADGKILTAGSIMNNAGNEQFGISRYNEDGSLDISFGNEGVSIISFNSSRDRIYNLGLQSSGKIIGVGTTEINPSIYRENTLIRLNIDGSLDSTFGVNGSIIGSLNSDSATAIHNIKIQPDDKIITISIGWDGIYYKSSLARFHPNGLVDSTFGTNGFTVDPLYSTLWGTAIQPDSKIIVTGFIRESYGVNHALIQRYDSLGIIDSTFGVNGSVIQDFGENDERFGKGPQIQPDGKIIAAGWKGPIGTITAGTSDMIIARYNIDGSIDSSFGNNGFIIQDEIDPIELTRSISNRTYSGSIILPDGKIIVSAWNHYVKEKSGVNYEASDVTFYKYNTNGTLDVSFGTNGYYRNNLSINTEVSNTRIDDFELLSNGKILVGGAMHTYGGTVNYVSNVLARFEEINFTNIEEFTTNIHVYPNPTSDYIYLKSGKNIESIEIIDLIGKVIEKHKVNSTEYQVNLTNYKSGIYLAHIKSENTITINRVIKN